MIKIAPSMLSCDFAHAGDDIKRLEAAGADLVHLDVMDGVFVPNITFGAPVIKSWRKQSKLFFDTHLMITEPGRFIEDFVKAGSGLITIHYESCSNPGEVIKKIASYGVKAGISVKPATDISIVEPFLEDLDFILIMSVEPGFGGQKFIPDSLDKIRKCSELVKKTDRRIEIEVDGGINTSNIGEIAAAGCTVAVVGSAVFNSEDIAKAITALKNV